MYVYSMYLLTSDLMHAACTYQLALQSPWSIHSVAVPLSLSESASSPSYVCRPTRLSVSRMLCQAKVKRGDAQFWQRGGRMASLSIWFVAENFNSQ